MHPTAILLTALVFAGAGLIAAGFTGAHDRYRRGAGGAGRVFLLRAGPGSAMCLFVYLVLPDLQLMIAAALTGAMLAVAATVYLRRRGTRFWNRRSLQRHRGTRR